MDLSIIIPMYNAEKYITRCLNSLLAQDIQNNSYEIIIINDGSTDKSLDVAESFAEKHINIKVFSTKNLGSSSARNLGIKLAKGNYIHFMDSDDYITSNSLKIIIDIVKKNNLDILGFKFLRTKKTNLVTLNKLSSEEKNIQIWSGEDYLTNLNYYRDSSCWYLIKREYLISSNKLFHVNRYLQDTIFTAQVFINAQRVSYIPLEVYRYVINPNSVWTNKSSTHLKKIVNDFTFITIKYHNLLKSLNNPNLKKRLEYNQNQMTLNIMKRLLESDFNHTEIKEILEKLKKENLFPLQSFHLKSIKQFKTWLFSFMFKNKIRFFTSKYIFNCIIFFKIF